MPPFAGMTGEAIVISSEAEKSLGCPPAHGEPSARLLPTLLETPIANIRITHACPVIADTWTRGVRSTDGNSSAVLYIHADSCVHANSCVHADAHPNGCNANCNRNARG